MSKSTFPKIINFDEEVTYCLEHQMIPTWERYGVDHLVVGAETLSKFRKQLLPEQVNVWRKKRESKSAPKRKRIHRGSDTLKLWPNEDQYALRFPVLIYVRSGEAEFQLGDYIIQCPEGHFLLIPAGVSRPMGKLPHLQEPYFGKKCEIWWFKSRNNYDYVSLSVCYSEGEKHANSGQYYIVSDLHVAQFFRFLLKKSSLSQKVTKK